MFAKEGFVFSRYSRRTEEVAMVKILPLGREGS
jgi:hypothetical protein